MAAKLKLIFSQLCTPLIKLSYDYLVSSRIQIEKKLENLLKG